MKPFDPITFFNPIQRAPLESLLLVWTGYEGNVSRLYHGLLSEAAGVVTSKNTLNSSWEWLPLHYTFTTKLLLKRFKRLRINECV
jgi:hypothetical protein